MSGHTPGPWRTGKPREGHHTKFPHCVVFSSQGQVAYANWTPERDANAHLIAAAPELLFCCKKLLSAYEKRESIPDGWVSEIRAAIAKAEGK